MMELMMKNPSTLQAISIILLVVNGVGALFGGIALTIDPTGRSLHMPLGMLKHSPFADYLIPGMILLVVLGVGSIAASLLVIRSVKAYPLFVAAVGITLTIWIVVQVLMIRSVHFLHVMFGCIGIALIILGVMQQGRLGEESKASHP
jgi:hypothetical protein